MGTPVTAPGEERRAVLLGGGEILDYESVAARIMPGDFIVCADSGYDHCGRLGIVPHLLVGDFDSVRTPLPPQIPRLPFPAEKDYTDTALALETLLERGFHRLLLVGMFGGRLDHTLANLQSLAHLSAAGAARAIMTDGLTDAYALTDGEMILRPRERCYFSLFSCSRECLGVSIRGAKYPLNGHTLRFDVPRAVSNEFLGEDVRIAVRSGTLLVIVVPM